MSAEPAREVEVCSGERIAPTSSGHIRQRMGNVREAFRLRRLARDQRRLHELYDEHNLFAQARSARREMMQLLRTARSSWRLALGFVP